MQAGLDGVFAIEQMADVLISGKPIPLGRGCVVEARLTQVVTGCHGA